MTQQIINYEEEMVGANHPTKSDTLNRALLVSHADNGGLRNGTSFPASDLEDRMYFYRTDEDSLYVYDLGDTTWRAVGAKFDAGAYTGDGNSSQAVTGVGFQPKFLFVWDQADQVAPNPIFRSDQDATTYSMYHSHNDSKWHYVTTAITSLDSDGFTVGSAINTNAHTYAYVAWG